MLPEQAKSAFFSLIFILFSGVFVIGNIIERDQTSLLMLAYFSSFAAFVGLSKFFTSHFRLLFFFGILCRLTFFTHLPSLSDDIFRFVWDGYLIKSGISPYLHLPSSFSNPIFQQQSALFTLLNSPAYYSVYPPLLQVIFVSAVLVSDWIADGSWLVSANVIRVIFLLTDVASFYLLRSLLESHKSKAFWYFLNPLVMIETTGNLHAEGLVVLFILFSLVQFRKNKVFLSGLGVGLAIASKFLPLLFLPAMGYALRWKRGLGLVFSALIIIIIFTFPLFNPFLSGLTTQSFSLYFQKFEFNASIYFLMRSVGYWIYGFNKITQIGPFLAILTLISVLFWVWFADHQKIEIVKQLLFSLLIYLSLSTTVHPWYILPLIPLGLISGFYFPLVWSFVIFVTYAGYHATGYDLPLVWIFIEYLIVFTILIYEIIKKSKSTHISNRNSSIELASLRSNDI